MTVAEHYKETNITLNEFTLHVYTSTVLPVKPYWHIYLTTLYIYWTYKDDICISLLQAYKVVRCVDRCKKLTITFKRRNKREDKK